MREKECFIMQEQCIYVTGYSMCMDEAWSLFAEKQLVEKACIEFDF